jgi:UDPglucose--hexose-1-phosphate uridylyltransferase
MKPALVDWVSMSEIREDRITGKRVIIAPERAKRGGNLLQAVERAQIPPFLESCPFCLGNESAAADERFRLDAGDDHWLLRSVVNKFSVLSSAGEVTPLSPASSARASANGVGLHEVLIESPRHGLSMALFLEAQVQRILEACRHRFLEFHRDPRVRQ